MCVWGGECRAGSLRVVARVKELGRGRKGLGSCGASRGTGGCYLRKGMRGGKRAVASGAYLPQP